MGVLLSHKSNHEAAKKTPRAQQGGEPPQGIIWAVRKAEEPEEVT